MSAAQKLWALALLVIAAILLHFLRPVLVPFFASFILAYLGYPLVDRLQRWKFPRSVAVLAVFLLTFIVLGLILVLVIPMVIREIAALFAHAPEAAAWFQVHALPWLTAHFGIQPGA
ncbi:MAG: AI-2E family transporter, partial [Gammaproteobacteria bacterium]